MENTLWLEENTVKANLHHSNKEVAVEVKLYERPGPSLLRIVLTQHIIISVSHLNKTNKRQL